MTDDVPSNVKQRRLREIVDMFYSTASKHKQDKYIGSHQLVLVEGTSKKSGQDLVGRADSNIKVVFPSQPLPSVNCVDDHCVPVTGEFVKVKVCAHSWCVCGCDVYVYTNIVCNCARLIFQHIQYVKARF